MMKLRKRRLWLGSEVAVLVLVPVVLTACSPSDPDSPSVPKSTQSTVAKRPETAEHVAMKLSPRSMEKCLALLRKNPNDPAGHRGLGQIYDEQKNYAKAAEYFRKAVELEPKNTYSRRRLGMMLGLAGQHEEAIKTLEEVVRADDSESWFASKDIEAIKRKMR